ncbi:MAG: ATP/GTP-binding protein [Actinobacteria bacterium]|nr:ATP/GTP-binding protein [Actinomycetota bacterium]
MDRIYKILVAGPFNSGKTTFISSISDIDVVSTERDTGVGKKKCGTTVAMDFGRIALKGGNVMHLYGTPGLKRFDFMWEVLSGGILGYVLLIDGTRPSTHEKARSVLESFEGKLEVPVVVGITRSDRRNCMGPAKAREKLGRSDLEIIPCDARRVQDVKAVLVALLDKVKEQEGTVRRVV